ncbi:PREDICTED: telomerase reverse transcriptase-like [Erythranthe guttata]|uniref:telomerase reverse transcriptase-like n=1 Tax=Erythranthe guttata TaxID=4155 RepID=UPI00064DE331|nr:PREDICTED: telomerase reverse transcriptase-like [Erythranthe guttata]|eukprot:XP_012857065.1 PREDICTED: telomerase reverse transcriptase-like [Erythranthe guttata]
MDILDIGAKNNRVQIPMGIVCLYGDGSGDDGKMLEEDVLKKKIRLKILEQADLRRGYTLRVCALDSFHTSSIISTNRFKLLIGGMYRVSGTAENATAKNKSFLVNPGDPSDYSGLLNRCYVVVSVNAPPLRVFDPHCRWPQSEIVRRSIEMILSEEPASSNLICCDYDEDTRSSDVVDILTSSIWTLLLKRVGDILMVYLLKYTSIFLPLPRMKHRQITGDPINNLVPSVGLPFSKSQHRPVAQNGNFIEHCNFLFIFS